MFTFDTSYVPWMKVQGDISIVLKKISPFVPFTWSWHTLLDKCSKLPNMCSKGPAVQMFTENCLIKTKNQRWVAKIYVNVSDICKMSAMVKNISYNIY